MITIKEQVSLKLYSTMRLGGTARYACDITNEDDLLEALQYAEKKGLPVRAIGGGSNVIWKDEGFAGLLLVIRIDGFELQDNQRITFGAGMLWDKAVDVSVQAGLSGIECLSAIPGTVGGTPVQNVGAYGQEVKDTIVQVRAYDRHTKQFIEIAASECGFGYRTSRFKTIDSGRYIITYVTFLLRTEPLQPPFYDSLQRYLDENKITTYTPEILRKAVTEIRWSKLPNPEQVANNGSFFGNPIVEKHIIERLLQSFPDLVYWQQKDGSYKLSAGWLVEHAGFNDFHDQKTGMATWHKQNLVLVNEHAQYTEQLLQFVQHIQTSVHDTFGVTLIQEPEILP